MQWFLHLFFTTRPTVQPVGSKGPLWDLKVGLPYTTTSSQEEYKTHQHQ